MKVAMGKKEGEERGRERKRDDAGGGGEVG